jgi:hypothetical protein
MTFLSLFVSFALGNLNASMKHVIVIFILMQTYGCSGQVHFEDLKFIYLNEMGKADSFLNSKNGLWKPTRDANGKMQIWTTTSGHLLSIVKMVSEDPDNSFAILNMFSSYTFSTVGGEILYDISKAGMQQIGSTQDFTDGTYTASFRESNNNGRRQLSIVYAKTAYFVNHKVR